MTSYTDADVQAAKDALDEWLFRMHGLTSSCRHEDEARGLLDAVASAIAARAKAEAWDEGHRTRWVREMDDCQCGAWHRGECGCGKYGTGRLITPNPYRADEIERI